MEVADNFIYKTLYALTTEVCLFLWEKPVSLVRCFAADVARIFRQSNENG